jgi:lactate dehydrogenase-like 2-hydroxyacid dehydrogenase
MLSVVGALQAKESPGAASIAVLNAKSCLDAPSVEALRSLGAVKIYEDTDDAAKAIERMRGAEVAIVQSFIAPLDAAVLDNTEGLKLLVVCSTGYDRVDMAAAKRRGIRVANIRGASTDAVAEHAFALMLAVSKHIPALDAAVRRHPFELEGTSPAERKFLGFNLAGKTLGIVGLGQIGTRVAEIARGFGMTVLAWDRSSRSVEGVKNVTLEQLLQQSDVVSLHVALTPDTENLLNASRLQLMKPTAVLINTARGKVVDEAALYTALKSGRLAGAGLDVLAKIDSGNPLLGLDNVVLSPHSAFFTREALRNRADSVVATVRAYLNGTPINIVSDP